jgi:hypothetical protein
MIVDVLEASGASGGAALSRRRKIPLDVEPLRAILLHEPGVGDRVFR